LCIDDFVKRFQASVALSQRGSLVNDA